MGNIMALLLQQFARGVLELCIFLSTATKKILCCFYNTVSTSAKETMAPPPPPSLSELMALEYASSMTAQSPVSSPISPRRGKAVLVSLSDPQASGSSLPSSSFSFPAVASSSSSPMPLLTLPVEELMPSAPLSPGAGKAALVSPSEPQASDSSLPSSSFTFPKVASSSPPMPLFTLRVEDLMPSAPVPLASADDIKGSNPVPQKEIDKLKNEMIVLCYTVQNSEDFLIENIDKLINVLYSMKELKLQEQGLDETETVIAQETLDVVPEAKSDSVPERFKCPISKELMTDPVILANGQTCDRPHIEQYLKKGIWICPITDEVLENDRLTPNSFARDIISEWCKEIGLDYPEPKKDDEEKEYKDYYSLTVQLERLVGSFTNKVEAAKVIKNLTKEKHYVRKFFGSYPDAIHRLLGPLKEGVATGIFHLQQDLIAAVFHILAQDDRNKKELARSENVISLIVESIRDGTISTSCHAAAALLLLSTLDSSKPIIGKAGALTHLIELLNEGHPSAVHVASAAISKLCTADENIERAIEQGIVKVILRKINARIFLDDFFDTLILLSSHQNALEQMHDCGAESLFQNIMDEELSKEAKRKCCLIVTAVRCYANRILQREKYDANAAEPSGKWTLSRRTRGIPTWL